MRLLKLYVYRLFVIAFLSSLFACGGDSDNSNGANNNTENIRLLFPVGNAIVTPEEATLLFKGTVDDAERIVSLVISDEDANTPDVPVTFGSDNHWQAEVPLLFGGEKYTATVTTIDGEVSEQSWRVTRPPTGDYSSANAGWDKLEELTDWSSDYSEAPLVVDIPDQQKLFVIERRIYRGYPEEIPRIITMDLVSGRQTIEAFSFPDNVTYLDQVFAITDNDLLFTARMDTEAGQSAGKSVLLQLDLNAMEFSHFSGTDPVTGSVLGSGPEFLGITDVAADYAENRLLVVDQGQILAVDLTTRDRSIHNALAHIVPSVSDGDWKLDLMNNRLVGISGEDVVVVELNAGTSRVVTERVEHEGVFLPDLSVEAIDSANNRAFIRAVSSDAKPPSRSLSVVDLTRASHYGKWGDVPGSEAKMTSGNRLWIVERDDYIGIDLYDITSGKKVSVIR